MEIEPLYKFIKSASRIRLFRSASFIIFAGVGLLVLNEYFLRIRFSVCPAVPYIFYWLVIAITFSALLLIAVSSASRIGRKYGNGF